MSESNGRMTALLERIALSSERMEKEVAKLRKTQTETNRRIDVGFAGTNRRLDQTNKRLDNMITFMGSHHADHERRLQVLEDRVFPKPKG